MMMMMAEEFQESDVIFSDEYDSSSNGSSNKYNFNYCRSKAKKQRKKQKSGSVPIHIPKNGTSFSSSDSDEDDEILPPHLIVAKRLAEGIAFGGYGRALKGRELSEVRNSILRMTGFLET
ncbi:unnamed protein product [Rhodiola kirilowii]